MRKQNRLKIIDQCLDEIRTGRSTLEECEKNYPELKQELREAYTVYRRFDTSSMPVLSDAKRVELGRRIQMALPDRGNLVTKKHGLRYRWQNTKRRFSMTWVIIVTTLLSLISGTGVVYASNDALPGEGLYPVKTWIEDVQLFLASDSEDVELSGIFASRRLEELIALMDEGDEDDLQEALNGYQNRTQLMARAMEKVQSEDPEEALRLQTKLETKLREQAQIIETLMDGSVENPDKPLQDQLRVMLETNTQTQLRIHAEEPVEEPVVDETQVEDVPETPEDETIEENESPEQYQNQNQNRNRVEYSSDELLDNGSLLFHFKFSEPISDDVYAEISGTIYDCSVEGALVTCDLTGSAGQGNLKLFAAQSHDLLFDFEYDHDYDHDYEYLWSGTKEGGNENQQQQPQQQGSPESGEGDHDNGRSGGNSK